MQDGWQAASDANADLRLAGDELNPHFAYDDEDDHVRHQVWMLDAVTALNELRAARQMGVQTIRLVAAGRGGSFAVVDLGPSQQYDGAAVAQADTAGR